MRNNLALQVITHVGGRVLGALAATVLLAWSHHSFAFSVGKLAGVPVPFTEEVHQGITSEAFDQISVSTAKYGELKFTGKAIDEMIRANVDTDDDWGVHIYHFDNNEMFASSQYILDVKQNIRSALSAIDPGLGPDAYADARHTLGHILHPLQDFYAHSNWASYHGVINASLGVTTIHTYTGDACVSGDPSTVITSIPISGFFPNPTAFGQCMHGNGVGPTGIHKDNSGRDWYPTARQLALLATVRFVRDEILASISDEKGLCLFLGHSSDECNGDQECVFPGGDTSLFTALWPRETIFKAGSSYSFGANTCYQAPKLPDGQTLVFYGGLVGLPPSALAKGFDISPGTMSTSPGFEGWKVQPFVTAGTCAQGLFQNSPCNQIPAGSISLIMPPDFEGNFSLFVNSGGQWRINAIDCTKNPALCWSGAFDGGTPFTWKVVKPAE